MNTSEHLLTVVAEECAEVAQRVSKALRFSLGEIQAGQSLTNAERIIQEYDDLRGAVLMCQDEGILPYSDLCRINAKRSKIKCYLKYSSAVGALTDYPANPTADTTAKLVSMQRLLNDALIEAAELRAQMSDLADAHNREMQHLRTFLGHHL